MLDHCLPCAGALHANRAPLAEADPEGRRRAVAWLKQQRDERAGWVKEAEQVLTGLAADDPRRVAGERRWLEGLRAYELFCRALPDAPATTCLDCGRPSPNGLTPCDACPADDEGAANHGPPG